MIYTVTANPSLDYRVDIPDFRMGVVNRTAAESVCAGGKGINVSVVLHRLGIENRALGFVAGFTGAEIERLLLAQGVTSDFVHLGAGFSRINVKLRSHAESEINGRGPQITARDIDVLLLQLDALTACDTLVLAGSIPASLPETFYRDIMARLERTGVRFVVDATRNLLVAAMAHKPFLVKPNNYELGDIFGVTLATRTDVVPYAARLRDMGAQNVLVSLAGQGAVLSAADGAIYQGDAPQITLVNSVGAGDSMVAGFLAGYQQTQNYAEALKMGLCAGSASASSASLTKNYKKSIIQTKQNKNKQTAK